MPARRSLAWRAAPPISCATKPARQPNRSALRPMIWDKPVATTAYATANTASVAHACQRARARCDAAALESHGLSPGRATWTGLRRRWSRSFHCSVADWCGAVPGSRIPEPGTHSGKPSAARSPAPSSRAGTRAAWTLRSLPSRALRVLRAQLGDRREALIRPVPAQLRSRAPPTRRQAVRRSS